MIHYSTNERLEFAEYHEFLKRTDLGSQYPKDNFEGRVKKLLQKCSLTITARNEKKVLVGVCLGLTDFAYFLFVSDLGVDREYVGRGIGKRLMNLIVEEAGGEDNITVTTISNENAFGFYEKMGMRKDECLFWKCCNKWTEHVVE